MMEIVEFNGWPKNVRLANSEVELIATCDVGPRVIRFAFIGERNLFAEIEGQQGGKEEESWMIRGGHRLWAAPEDPLITYELDNKAVEAEDIPGGVRLCQAPGDTTGLAKTMEISLSANANEVRILHRLTNAGADGIELAPWALSVMAPSGMAVIPLPAMIRHDERLTHNQEWSIWGYTDFSDPRWTLGSRYVLLRQDSARGPTKIGMAHREGWVGYQLDGFVFMKHFAGIAADAKYPDGGVNFETYTAEDFLELETLGPLVTLAPGESVEHEERWTLHKDVAPCKTEGDVDAAIRPLA